MRPLEVGCNWNYPVGGFVPWEIWVWCTHTTKSEKGLWCQNWGQVTVSLRGQRDRRGPWGRIESPEGGQPATSPDNPKSIPFGQLAEALHSFSGPANNGAIYLCE